MVNHRLFRHVRTNNVYIVINEEVYIEATGEKAVAYARAYPTHDRNTHKVWIRPHKEFMDGRFKVVILKE